MAGRGLHVVLDDGNVADAFVDGCVQYAIDCDDAAGAVLACVLKRMSKPPIEYFKMFYGDTVLGGSTSALRCGLDFFGVDNVLFASDCPFDPEGGPMFIREGIRSVDRTSLIVDVAAGTFGDVFEDALRADYSLTCGHWPQSIALSTVGGWVACRGAGQLSTRYGKIGTEGQMSMKEWDDEERAKKEYDKLVAEKTKKGYEEK